MEKNQNKMNIHDIEYFKNINTIIANNLDSNLVITQDDLNNFKYIFNYFIFNFNESVMKSVINNYSKYIFQDDITEEDKISFFKQFIILATFLHFYMETKKLPDFSEVEFVNLSKMMLNFSKKLFFLKIFSENEIVFLIKYVLILSMTKDIRTKNFIRVNKNICNKMAWVSISFFCNLFENNIEKETANYIITEVLNFINTKIIQNAPNHKIFSCTLVFLEIFGLASLDYISAENKRHIITMTTNIYEWSFNINIFTHIMYQLKRALINQTNNKESNVLCQDMTRMNNYIVLFKELIRINHKNLKDNPYKTMNGFSFTSNCGIVLEHINEFNKKGFTIIFSFKWIPVNTNDIKHYLLSFVQWKESDKKDDNKELIAIYLEKGKLHINMLSKLQQIGLDILPNITYLITLSFYDKSYFTIKKPIVYISYSINGIDNNYETALEVPSYPKGRMKCLVGFNYFQKDNEECFSGNMGTILVINKSISINIIKKIHELKRMYEHILFLKCELYAPDKKGINQEVINFLIESKSEEFNENLLMIISSRVNNL